MHIQRRTETHEREREKRDDTMEYELVSVVQCVYRVKMWLWDTHTYIHTQTYA